MFKFEDVIIILILAIIVVGIVFFIIRSKKRGDVCVGCPHAKNCKKGKCNCNDKESNNA